MTLAATTGGVSLYRLYDTTGQLLYIGTTINPVRRWRDHAETKPWWRDVARRDVEWYESRKIAALAEAVAIRGERPLYNQVLPAGDGSDRHQPIDRPLGGSYTRYRKLRVPNDLWRDFTAAIGPGPATSEIICQFMRWYLDEPGVSLPERAADQRDALAAPGGNQHERES